jgi:hypothetical protein
MEAQTLPFLREIGKTLDDVDVVAQTATAPKTKPVTPGVSQEAIGGAGDQDVSTNAVPTDTSVSGNPDVAGMQNVQTTNSGPMGDAGPEGMGTQDEGQNQEQGSGADPGSLEDSIYKSLVSVGVLQREWDMKKESLFQEKVDLNTKTRSGFYLIPSFTRAKKISGKEAQQIASDIANKFGLQSTIITQGKYYKVTFQTAQQQNNEHGSAFDSIPVKSQGKQKSASTLEGMLKAQREELFQTMNKIANRTETK